jgi:hypothetical protein
MSWNQGFNLQGTTGSGVPTSAWTTYTPTWTADSGTPTIGNGTLSGRYQTIGKTCFVQMYMVLGSTSNVSGTGTWHFSLPLTAQGPYAVVLPTTMLNNGNYWVVAQAFSGYSGSTSTVTIVSQAGTNPAGVPISSTTPFTWTIGHSINICGSYETA